MNVKTQALVGAPQELGGHRRLEVGGVAARGEKRVGLAEHLAKERGLALEHDCKGRRAREGGGVASRYRGPKQRLPMRGARRRGTPGRDGHGRAWRRMVVLRNSRVRLPS